jgi:hypothetical protein
MSMTRKARAKLLREYFDLNEQKKQIEKRLAEIKKDADLTRPEIFEVDEDVVMEVKPRREFSAALAQEQLAPDVFELISVRVPKKELIDRYLTGEERAELTREVGVTVTWRKNN